MRVNGNFSILLFHTRGSDLLAYFNLEFLFFIFTTHLDLSVVYRLHWSNLLVKWLHSGFFCIFLSQRLQRKIIVLSICTFVTKKSQLLSIHLSVGIIFLLNSGDTCVGAKPTPEIYSTRNILLSSESVFIVEFSLKCDNNAKVKEWMWKWACGVRFKICLNYWYSSCPKMFLTVCWYEKSICKSFGSLKLLLKQENTYNFRYVYRLNLHWQSEKRKPIFAGLFKTKKLHTVCSIHFVELDGVTCVHLSICVDCRSMLETEMTSFQRRKWWTWISYHECMIIFLHFLICLWNRLV